MFLYAFVLIEPSRLVDVTDEVRSLYLQEGLPLSELKSSKLSVSLRGLRRYSAIGRIVTECGARICLSVVEKRYQACTMICETYLDPELHDDAPPEMRRPQFRQKFADACYDYLEDSRIEQFLEIVRADQPEQIADIGRQLSLTLQFHPDGFVSYAASKMEVRPTEVFRYAEAMAKIAGNPRMPASQSAAFYPGISRVDAYLRANNGTAALIRDRDSQYGSLLDLTFQSAQHTDRNPGAWAYGARWPVSQIHSCREAVSTEEFGIQLADLAAGLFGRLVLRVLAAKPIRPEFEAVARSWQPALIALNNHYWMLSDAFAESVVQTVLGSEVS